MTCFHIMDIETKLKQIESVLETTLCYIVRYEKVIARQDRVITQLHKKSAKVDLALLEVSEALKQLCKHQEINQRDILKIWKYLESSKNI